MNVSENLESQESESSGIVGIFWNPLPNKIKLSISLYRVWYSTKLQTQNRSASISEISANYSQDE